MYSILLAHRAYTGRTSQMTGPVYDLYGHDMHILTLRTTYRYYNQLCFMFCLSWFLRFWF